MGRRLHASGGVAHNQSAGHGVNTRVGIGVNGLQQSWCRNASDLGEIRVDGGERRARSEDHGVPVVVTDDRDVLGDTPPLFAEGVRDSGRGVVGALLPLAVTVPPPAPATEVR